jgi:pyrroline-5-carboxylate reductase
MIVEAFIRRECESRSQATSRSTISAHDGDGRAPLRQLATDESKNDMRNPDILLIGCGNMGAALSAGSIAAAPGTRIVAIDPDVERARSLLPKGESVSVHASLDELEDDVPGLTILAVKPQMMASILPSLAPRAAARGLVVSIAAGVDVATLGAQLPEARIVRAMPNTPALVGAGFTALWGAAAVGEKDRRRCAALFDAVGVTHWLKTEAEIDAVTAVSGSGPAYFFAIIEALVNAGTSLGLPAPLADEMARHTMAGAAAMLRDPAARPADLKAAVRSPKGTTDAALRIFEEGDALGRLIGHAVSAAHARAVALRETAS